MTSLPEDRGTRTMVAARRLRELIVSGALAPGQRITERLVSHQLDGMSRTPLREAFKVLEAEGLVRIEPNRGAVVTSLSVDEVAAAIEVIIGLETLAAEPACERITDAGLAAIEELHARMEQAWRDGDLMAYFQLNQTIHQRLVDAAGNPVLSRIYASECARVQRYRYAGNQQHARWERAVQEHAAMLDALRQRAGAVLRELLRQHHRNGWVVSRQVLQTRDAAPAAAQVAPPPRGRKAAVH
ncbi:MULTISPECIES: GntR family transcriptional regulator [Ramlibacter]|uniref:FCD domain-containing protein n=1 Tax=Ramlibacter pinisoli TaxID=2682844 RepID=A0A6N8IZL9_9BURK|nr:MULTISPECIES: GntR family transcriptional regulator [Ramlibacter]MBA2961537.1 GntR family transcriptional regulator [Ramlibacter sp. CGMCC 1.13660]MVQ31480.1 FCD domain-containing protein [Ramlibacter pinisoli]